MKIEIDVECPEWMKKLGRVGVPVLAIGVAGIALGAPPVLVSFTPGMTLTSSDLNKNFKALADASVTATEWASYTVNVTANGAAVTTVSEKGGTAPTGYWRRVGDSIEVTIATSFPSCSVAGELVWSLPPNLVPDTSKLPADYQSIGSGVTFNGATGVTGSVVVAAQGTSPFVALEKPTTSGGVDCTSIGNAGLARLTFRMPIQGWTVNN